VIRNAGIQVLQPTVRKGRSNSVRGLLKRLRGAIGNALVWAVAWAGGVAAFLLVYSLFLDLTPGAHPWRGIDKIAGLFGGMGFLCGGAFSLYLGVIGRNKRLDELGAIRYGLRGAIAAGLILPIFAFVVHGPGGFEFWLVTFLESAIAIVLGGISAFGTVKLAQGSDRILVEASLGELQEEQDEVLPLLEDGS